VNAVDLIAFEKEVAEAFEAGKIRGPVHLSGGNESQLIEIFKEVRRTDWVFSTWRNHYHALLHGVPREKLMAHILNGPSMNINFPEHRFVTSAIVGGILPIACGVAAGIKRRGGTDRVWCFVGDMAATTGAFHEASRYASRQDLPIYFVTEDNDLSTNTPTEETWGMNGNSWHCLRGYSYTRSVPHVGTGKWVTM
jgi:TPP-dependent pyruvate/acetoin dehydrogenase alpha subunit